VAAGLGLSPAALALAQPSSPFAPASPEARAIADLFFGLLIVAGLIFLFVAGMIVYMAARYRARPGEPDPPPKVGGHALEILWTITPAIVLAIVFLLTIPALLNLPTPKNPDLVVVATGHRFWWEFRYPDLGVVTANELHIPVDTDVKVQLQSADVIHSFWIPRLNGKQDLIPGKTNEVALYTNEPGTYLGQCAEFCGLQHAWMLLRVIAAPAPEFQAWVAAQRQAPARPTDGLAARGYDVFFGQTCINCHAINGTPANATIGPNLTHVGSRQTLAAGALTNTPENLRRWLENPQAIKPGAEMPAFALSQDDFAALTAYLEGLK
jgi:cytochrome c oxidase subunit 2